MTLEALWQNSGAAVALVMGTSEYVPGTARVSFLVVANNGRAVARPTADVWIARSRDDRPLARTIAHLERVGVSADVQSIYVAHVHVPRAGRYWILARPIGGDVRIGGIATLDVKAQSATPAVGAKAPASDNPTLGTAPIRLLTTSVPPDRALLRYTIAGSLHAHAPFVVVFATPRFCTSRTCGPVVNVVQTVRKELRRSAVRFIHVEIYRDNNPAKGNNRWVRQWRLQTEPWVFLVGRDGRIKAKFEGAISPGELERAVRSRLS
jgi:hypothetical protein